MKKIICLLTFFAFLIINYNSIELDGPKGLILKIIYPHNTVYANGYSDNKFISIKLGDNYLNVEKLIGYPLETYKIKNGLIGMRWSKPYSDCSYCVRVILFNNSKVVSKLSEFYND